MGRDRKAFFYTSQNILRLRLFGFHADSYKFMFKFILVALVLNN